MAKPADHSSGASLRADAPLAAHPYVSPAEIPLSPTLKPTRLRLIHAAPASTVARVASVDALRGFAMIWIIGADALALALKQAAGDSDSALAAVGRFLGGQFEHVDWEGYRFYDLILPLFIFVTGVSIAFALPKLVAQDGLASAHGRVLRRALILFALGVLYYGGASNAWPDIRLLGVLQRIALCYLATSLLFLHLDLRGLVAAFVALLAGYWALMTFVPVPDIGAGVFLKQANLAAWIDMQFLPGMKWDGRWDPEGLLSTLPAIGTCILGVFAGLLLKDERVQPFRKSLWLIGGGIALVVAGHLWGLQFPVVKKIWTSSFVLVAGGYSLVLLGVFHQIMDVWKRDGWNPILIWIGANAITLYLLQNVMGFDKIAARFVGGDVSAFVDAQLTTGAGDIVKAVLALVLATLLARFLYQRRIFLRV